MKDHYFFIDQNGGQSPPTNDNFNNHWINGRTPIIILDACVCLDIIKFIDKQKFSSSSDLERVKNFLIYSTSAICDFLCSLGILELCIERPNFSIDSKKFESMGEKILFSFSLNKEEIENQKFSFNNLGKIKDELKNVEILVPMLIASYCSLLKSHLIGKHDRKKENSKSKVFTLIDWMFNEFGSFMMLEYHLAKKAYFNNSKFWKMLWLEGKPELTKQKLFSTAWDIMHYRINCQHAAFNSIDGKIYHPYLVTNDSYLNDLVTDWKVEFFENGGYGMSTNNELTADDYQIHQYIAKTLQNRKSLNADYKSTLDMIQKLENQLG